MEGYIRSLGACDSGGAVATEAECSIFCAGRFIATEVKGTDFNSAEQTAGNLGLYHAINAPGESRAAKGGKQDCATGYAKKSRTPHKCLLFLFKSLPKHLNPRINLHIYYDFAIEIKYFLPFLRKLLHVSV
jgi:hypothetical protein